MTDEFDDIEKTMLEAAQSIAPKVDSMILIVSRYPTHDDGIGRVQFIRQGRGPAYQLALRTLLSEVDMVGIDIDEITPGDYAPDDDED